MISYRLDPRNTQFPYIRTTKENAHTDLMSSYIDMRIEYKRIP